MNRRSGAGTRPIHGMYMFCGDSHLRQFRDYFGPGIFSLTSFPGATMKGLARPQAGHRQVILDLASAPMPKTLLLMFGNVDLDVTWFRKSVLEGQVDEKDFFRERLDALTTFIDECRRLAGDLVMRTCVLLPQLPAVADPHFVEVTAQMSRLEEGQVAQLATGQDCSHLARCERTTRFNDYISQGAPSGTDLTVFRIDDQMADETGLITPEFVRDGPPNLHASEATLSLWWDLLKDEVPGFRIVDELRQDPRWYRGGWTAGETPELKE